jgi:hypothetical protein
MPFSFRKTHPNFIITNIKNVRIAGINTRTASTDTKLRSSFRPLSARKAVNALHALKIIPIHIEFHHACRGAVKAIGSHIQQDTSKIKPRNNFVFNYGRC